MYLIENKPVYLNIFENVPGGVWKRESNYRYFSLLVTALSFTTTAGSDKLKALARVGVFSTAITKFN